jgi:Flp pilus assembly pilin Flp
MNMMVKFLKDERGMELPEYAVNTALIIGLVAGVITALAAAVSARFQLLTDLVGPGGTP